MQCCRLSQNALHSSIPASSPHITVHISRHGKHEDMTAMHAVLPLPYPPCDFKAGNTDKPNNERIPYGKVDLHSWHRQCYLFIPVRLQVPMLSKFPTSFVILLMHRKDCCTHPSMPGMCRSINMRSNPRPPTPL